MTGWRGLLLLCLACCLLQQSVALVQLGPLTPWSFQWQPPVTNWLLPSDPSIIPPNNVLAWRKLGSKIWTFLSTLDHDFVDATGATVPPALATQRAFGPSVSCGRFARLFIRMPFHDCGTFDVGNTGSIGDTKLPRFGCNGSLRWEVGPCTAGAPQCVNGVEAAIDLATGAFLPETAFASVEAKYGTANVLWGQDPNFQRRENIGFANALAFLYQLKFETMLDEPPITWLAQVSLADIIMYAGMIAVAKCDGPHIEFHPGRVDSAGFDAPERLPAPTEPLHHTISYFWTNGLTNFDMANLLAAHTTACFGVGCLDLTPTRFDSNWATQISSVTTATDPRICQFVAELPPPPPRNLCFLPADVELNARADIRNYLMVHTGQLLSIAAAAAVNNPCFYQPGVPQIYGDCDVGPGVYDFVPFRLVSTAGGSVNLCRRTNPDVDTSSCPRATIALRNFHDVVATSYFKMSKQYADASGAVAGARFGVARQPCQPGLIQIGTLDGLAPPNPLCLCCPNPLPQDFNLNLEPLACQAPPAANSNSSQVMPSSACSWNMVHSKDW